MTDTPGYGRNVKPRENPDPLEPLARAICEEMGFDPDETVSTDVLGPLTEKERADFGSFIPLVAVYVPRWELYRAKADQQLAIRRAFDRMNVT